MRIAILAAGAADMYCGSCLRENTLASALRRAGQEVTLVPLYTPLRTDLPGVGIGRIFYGGLNVYLQHASAIFRHTPRALDWLLDRPRLLRWAGRQGAGTSPAQLGPLTLDILRGGEGAQAKELHRLLAFLRDELRPEVVTLPNAMFLGTAPVLRRELAVPIICELTGEDIFLEAMSEPWRAQAHEMIRHRASDVTRFVATSACYADRMAGYLAVPRERIDVVHPGVPREYLSIPSADTRDPGHPEGRQRRRIWPSREDIAALPDPSVAPGSLRMTRDETSQQQAVVSERPPTVGYLARICPEKGLDRLIDAMVLLVQRPGLKQTVLKVAGYLSPANQSWFDDQLRRATAGGVKVEHLGEVDLAGKLAMLDSLDVLSVPTAYHESKGLYILEAAARGVPFVQPAHGSFPELAKLTGGGITVQPDCPEALAEGIASLLANEPQRIRLGTAGRSAVEAGFTDTQMAEKMLAVYANAQGVTTDQRTNDPTTDYGPLTTDSLLADKIEKSYPTPAGPLRVLRGISFRISRGETLAILGPSGSGKSTLLHILGGLDAPTAGRVTLGEVNPFSLNPGDLAAFRAKQVGFVFQDSHLLPQCAALENVLLPRLAIGKVESTHQERATVLLRQVGLADRLRHLPSELSGGERQRVAIARALMNAPQLLLCDEPTGNLDAASAEQVADVLRSVAREAGAILIVVTHSEKLAASFARRLRMLEGRAVEL